MHTFNFKKNTNTDIKLNTLQSPNFLLDFVLVRKWKHFCSALTQYNFSFNDLVQPTKQDINHFHCSRLSSGLVNVDEFLILSISLFLETYLQYLNAWTWWQDLPWLLKSFPWTTGSEPKYHFAETHLPSKSVTRLPLNPRELIRDLHNRKVHEESVLLSVFNSQHSICFWGCKPVQSSSLLSFTMLQSFSLCAIWSEAHWIQRKMPRRHLLCNVRSLLPAGLKIPELQSTEQQVSRMWRADKILLPKEWPLATCLLWQKRAFLKESSP